MIMSMRIRCVVVAVCAATGGTACSSSSSPATGPGGTTMPDAGQGSAQMPPQGASEVEAWLATGVYKTWHCESAPHDPRSPSPHTNFNRICSNDVVASNAGSSSDWREGAAAVKELYTNLTDATPSGYAVYLKTSADSSMGANWYWYERVPLDSPVPHDTSGVVAEGLGASFCTSCHVAAGSDVAHTPSVGSHDEVYTPVH